MKDIIKIVFIISVLLSVSSGYAFAQEEETSSWYIGFGIQAEYSKQYYNSSDAPDDTDFFAFYFTPTLQKPEGFRVKASEGEVVVFYFEPSAT